MRRRDLIFKRGQRQRPHLPQDEVEIPRYPPLPTRPQRMSKFLIIAPSFTMLIMALGMVFLFNNYTYAIIMFTISITYAGINIFRQREQEKRYQQELEKVQSAYARRIKEVEIELKLRREQQTTYLKTVYPLTKEIVTWAWEDSTRLWERSSRDEDFLDLRLGTGEVTSSYEINLPKIDIPELAPKQLVETKKMVLGYQSLVHMPITLSLSEEHTLALVGPPALREGLARSFLCQVVGLHAPRDVEIFAVYPSNKVNTWEWLKWLPHTHALHSGTIRHLGYEAETIREVYSGLLDILDERVLKKQDRELDGSTLILLVADPDLMQGEVVSQRILARGHELNARMILLAPNAQEVPEGFSARVSLSDDQIATLQLERRTRIQTLNPELTDLASAEKLARGLAPLQLADEHSPVGLPEEIRLLDLAGSPDLDLLDLERRWMEALSHPPELNVPLGMRHGQRPLVIDLKQSGVGPHGLIAGTTGSGKSELLLTLLTSLALNHHPHQVNFMLIDYKGGTAMNVLKDLPHTVGVVTDLDGKQTRRALIALGSEMERREAILTKARVADIDKYHQLGLAEPFPYLFIVIDEFAELREHFRDDLGEILREFVSVAQKGRALGVHLILAMQKPEGVVNDSIRANMKFRISLRVERAEDSRNVLGRPDAYLLPHKPPGRAYFQVGRDEQFDLFQVARVAGYQQHSGVTAKVKGPIVIQEVGPDGQRIPVFEIAPKLLGEDRSRSSRRTEAQVIVEKAIAAAEHLNIQTLTSPWPPPLPERVYLRSLFESMQSPIWEGEGWPERCDWDGVPVAMLDEPIHQQQRPLFLNPIEDGNILVVGSPGTGRTNFLLTFVNSLLLSMSPDWVHLHLIDFVGHQLRAACSGFPHVAGVYEASEIERIRRLLSTLNAELEERRRVFSEVGAVSLSGYRRVKAEATPMPMIISMINNFSGFYEVYREEITAWNRLLREGGSYGLYFVLTSDRIPMGRTADLIQTRIALRLTDRTWYSLILGSRPDLTTYDPLPGRGFINTKPPTELQVAVPFEGTPEDQISQLQILGQCMDQVWKGARPEPVRILGERVSFAEVFPKDVLERWPMREDLKTWIGLDHHELQPVVLDLQDVGSSMLISGPPESGKTTALTTLALSFALTHHPDRIKMGFFSLGRKGSIPVDELDRLPHSIGSAKTIKAIEAMLAKVELEVEQRLSKGSGEKQIGSHLAILIDDYHLITSRADQALIGRLEDLLRKGQEVGITMFVAVPNLGLSGAVDSMIRKLKSVRVGLWLKSTDLSEARTVGLTIPPGMRGQAWPPGRGYLYDPGGQVLLQVAAPSFALETSSTKEKVVSDYVAKIRTLSGG